MPRMQLIDKDTQASRDYVARAQAAESSDDWDRAKMFWYYAAQSLIGNPKGLRTRYGQNEDRAGEKAREAHRTLQ